jgi:protein SCO1/2
MGQAVEMVDAARKERVLPMFISVDPARDGVKEVKKYIMGEWSQPLHRPQTDR